MKFSSVRFNAVVCGGDESDVFKLSIPGHQFCLPGTELRLVAHKTIERKKRSGALGLASKRWMVSEPSTGLRVLHEREFRSRAGAVRAAGDTVFAVGMSITMEKILLAMSQNTDLETESLDEQQGKTP